MTDQTDLRHTHTRQEVLEVVREMREQYIDLLEFMRKRSDYYFSNAQKERMKAKIEALDEILREFSQ